MTKKYEIEFWEKQSVWVRHRIEVETDEKPTAENMKEILENESIEYLQSDYDWGTSENEEYDFETDFEINEN